MYYFNNFCKFSQPTTECESVKNPQCARLHVFTANKDSYCCFLGGICAYEKLVHTYQTILYHNPHEHIMNCMSYNATANRYQLSQCFDA